MKKKSDILIKVLSLGVGLAVGIVLIAKVFFELSYDSFYKDIDRVYTINTWYSHQGEEKDYGQVSGAVAVGFMDEVPGVEAGTRTTFVFNGDTYLDEEGNKLSGTLVCADTCFFQVFDRPILAGDPVRHCCMSCFHWPLPLSSSLPAAASWRTCWVCLSRRCWCRRVS